MSAEKEKIDLNPIARDYSKEFELYRAYVSKCIMNNTHSIDSFSEFANPNLPE